MGNLYGTVLAAVFPAFIIVVSWIVYKKRSHPFVKSRKPDFILVQNFGVIVSFFLTSLYIGLRPHYDCSFNVFSTILNITVVGFVLFARIWEYCLGFYLELLKAQFRFHEFAPDWSESSSWLYQHNWVAKHSFIRKVLVVACVVTTVPGLYFFTPSGTAKLDYNLNSLTCVLPFVWTTLYGVVSLALIVSGIVVAYLIRKSRDAYRLRREKLTLTLLWGLVFLSTYIYSIFASNRTKRVVPPTFFQLVGQFFTVCITNFFPLYYAYKIDTREPSKESQEKFELLLECPHFRNAFYKFLAAQFCGENLQFFESVQAWKALDPNNSKRRVNAKLIFENFVLDNGLCQVHIRSDVREQITELLSRADLPSSPSLPLSSPPPPLSLPLSIPSPPLLSSPLSPIALPSSLFDTAVAPLLEDMYYNSFLIYCDTREFVESISSELA